MPAFCHCERGVAIQIQPSRKAIRQVIQQKGWIATPHGMGLAMTSENVWQPLSNGDIQRMVGHLGAY